MEQKIMLKWDKNYKKAKLSLMILTCSIEEESKYSNKQSAISPKLLKIPLLTLAISTLFIAAYL